MFQNLLPTAKPSSIQRHCEDLPGEDLTRFRQEDLRRHQGFSTQPTLFGPRDQSCLAKGFADFTATDPNGLGQWKNSLGSFKLVLARIDTISLLPKAAAEDSLFIGENHRKPCVFSFYVDFEEGI